MKSSVVNDDVYFFFSLSTLKNLGLFAYLCYEKRIRARNF